MRPVDSFVDPLAPVQLKREKIRIMTTMGWFDMDKPVDFDLNAMMRAVRGDGFLCTPQLYVPLQCLGPVFVYSEDAKPTGDVVVNFPGKPPA